MRTRLFATCLLSTLVGAHLLADPVQTRRKPSAAAAVTVSFSITDPGGLPLSDVKVWGTGPVFRQSQSTAGGLTRFLNVKPGDYRLRFEHDGYLTLERDITVKTAALDVDVTLDPAPEAPAPPPPAPAPAPDSTASAPPGEAKSLDLVDFIERNGLGRDPVRSDSLGCTASATTTLVQIRDSLSEQARPDADEVLYVVAGEGALRLGNRDVPLSAASIAIVPRGTVRGLTRKGKNALIVLSVVSGKACTR
jgi:mannose-6-phosphate isomerase-like protein (cupin superfamily)